ncbi:serine protease SplB [Striga asiatica]|uniref:Serine protease SplB n=1 Tax=Striga asiatica TaxID=4170 RepID=A0A5A7P4Y0_STRAF|nr:serine protease SplB [Striga asiatica]
MADERWALLDKLKMAVKKIKILINFNLNKWKLASIVGASSGKKRLSFNDRPGLRACVDDQGPNSDSGSSSCRSLQRTISYPSSEDDIDRRAEAFIANFYKQLQYERQISLELRYYRGDSFGSSTSQ